MADALPLWPGGSRSGGPVQDSAGTRTAATAADVATPLWPGGPVQDGALRHAVADHVLAAVRGGQLASGARVHEVSLARALGVSLSPVREALFRLADQGLLEHRPRRGFYVRTMDERQTREVYTFRALLEGFAARTIAERVAQHHRGAAPRTASPRRTSAQAASRPVTSPRVTAPDPEHGAEASAGADEAALLRLAAIVDEGTRVALTGDRQTVGAINSRFHDLLVRAAGHSLVERSWALLAPAEWLLVPTWSWTEEPIAAAEARDWEARHRRLLGLLRAGDAAAAEREAAHHVRQAGEGNVQRRFHHKDVLLPDVRKAAPTKTTSMATRCGGRGGGHLHGGATPTGK